MDMVIKQRAALKQLLLPLLGEHGVTTDSTAQEFVDTGLLNVQVTG